MTSSLVQKVFQDITNIRIAIHQLSMGYAQPDRAREHDHESDQALTRVANFIRSQLSAFEDLPPQDLENGIVQANGIQTPLTPIAVETYAQLQRERDALVVERDALVVECDALVVERDALVVERDTLFKENMALLVKFVARIASIKATIKSTLNDVRSDKIISRRAKSELKKRLKSELKKLLTIK